MTYFERNVHPAGHLFAWGAHEHGVAFLFSLHDLDFGIWSQRWSDRPTNEYTLQYPRHYVHCLCVQKTWLWLVGWIELDVLNSSALLIEKLSGKAFTIATITLQWS